MSDFYFGYEVEWLDLETNTTVPAKVIGIENDKILIQFSAGKETKTERISRDELIQLKFF